MYLGYVDCWERYKIPIEIDFSVDESWLANAERIYFNRLHSAEKRRRNFNILVALFGTLVAIPVMSGIAIAVKLTSSGPVLYKQLRVGISCRLFTIYKFRTMQHTKSENLQVWAEKNDPRITPIGRFLRNTRLDELPQLFNVLRGDMNIVGPRPEQPDIFEMLKTKITNYEKRQHVLPGITGLAQVTLAYDSCINDVQKKVEADLAYIERKSVYEDFRIMLMTVPVMLFRKGSR